MILKKYLNLVSRFNRTIIILPSNRKVTMPNDYEDTSNNIKNYLDEKVERAKPRVMKIHDIEDIGSDRDVSFKEYA